MKLKATLILILLSTGLIGQTEKKLSLNDSSVVKAICDEIKTSKESLKTPDYKMSLKTKDILVPPQQFAAISAKYFSFLSAGQNVIAPSVNNFSLDLLDAKFDIKGATRLCANNNVLLNIGVSGDKEGNSATLFEDKKTGGNFDGELKVSFKLYGKFFYDPAEKERIWSKIREIDYKYYGDYLRLKICPPESIEKKCDALSDNEFLKCLSEDESTAMAKTLQAVIDSADAKKNEIFNSAKWSSVHMLWITPRFKIGGEKVYSITQTLNYKNDSIKTNNLLTAFAGAELNYYYNGSKGIVFYLNVGAGYERANNIIDLDKISVTESTSMKDTTIHDPNSGKRDLSTKYDAFTGKIITVENFMVYTNVYSLFGKQQLFGLHLGMEYRMHYSANNNINNTSFTAGLITNVPKKGDTKSIVSVEIFLKLNQVDKTTTINFGNEHKSQIGLTFNIPIPSLPKS